jgi:hypothetical protein
VHPFFDSAHYPWDRADAVAFHKRLYELIPDGNEIKWILRQCSTELYPLKDAGPREMWAELLDKVAAALLMGKLGAVLRGRPQPPVHAAFAVIELVAGAVPDPVPPEDRPFRPKPIFVDRKNLRASLRTLAAPDTGEFVLLVRGEADSGKTWTRHLIEQYAAQAGQDCTYLAQGLVSTPRQAMNAILAPLGGTVPESFTTEAASYQNACIEMQRLAEGRRKGSWVIMDDLGPGENGPRVDPTLRDLFDQIALYMKNPAFSRWFRLILIDYPEGPEPEKWDSFLEERTACADLQKPDVATFLLRWARHHRITLGAPEAEEIAAEVVSKADAPGTGFAGSRMSRLQGALKVALAQDRFNPGQAGAGGGA